MFGLKFLAVPLKIKFPASSPFQALTIEKSALKACSKIYIFPLNSLDSLPSATSVPKPTGVYTVGYLKGHTTAYLSDYVHFDNDIIETGVHQPWLISDKYNSKVESKNLININKLKETTSYLIIQNDSIVFEKYYLGYNQDSISNSFSMAKSFVSAMLGKAISDGYIKGLDQPVSDFFK